MVKCTGYLPSPEATENILFSALHSCQSRSVKVFSVRELSIALSISSGESGNQGCKQISLVLVLNIFCRSSIPSSSE